MLWNYGQVFITPTNTQALELVRLFGFSAPFTMSFDRFIQKYCLEKTIKSSSTFFEFITLKKFLEREDFGINTKKVEHILPVFQHLQTFSGLNFDRMDEIQKLVSEHNISSQFNKYLDLFFKHQDLIHQFGFSTKIKTYQDCLDREISNVVQKYKIQCIGFSQVSYFERKILGYDLQELSFENKEQEMRKLTIPELGGLSGKVAIVLPVGRPRQNSLVYELILNGIKVYAPDFLQASECQATDSSDYLWKDDLTQLEEEALSYGIKLDNEERNFFKFFFQPKTPGFSHLDGISLINPLGIPAGKYDHIIFTDLEVESNIPIWGNLFWEHMEAMGFSNFPSLHPLLIKRVREIQKRQAGTIALLDGSSATRENKAVVLPPVESKERKYESASSAKFYYDCPTKYFVKYGMNLDPQTPLRGIETDTLEKGKLIHKILEDFLKPFEGKKVSEVPWANLLKTPVPLKRDKELLENFVEMETEYSQKFPERVIYSLEKKYEVYLEEFKQGFVAKIDRIDTQDGKYFVWDYKTGGYELNENPQIFIYYAVLKNQFHLEFPQIQAGVLLLKQKKRIGLIEESRIKKEEFLQSWSQEVLAITEGIHKKDFGPKPRNASLCSGCFGRGVCGQ